MGPWVQGRQAPNASCPTFALRPGFLRGGVQVQMLAGLGESPSCSMCRTMGLLCKTPTPAPTQSGRRDSIQESKSFYETGLGSADFLVGWEFLSRTPDFIQDLTQTPQTVTQTTGELPWLIQLLLMHQTSRALEVLVIATHVSSALPQALHPLSLSAPRRLVSQYSGHCSRAPIALSGSARPLFLAFEALHGWFQQACLMSPFTGTQFSGLTTFCIFCVGFPLPPTFF